MDPKASADQVCSRERIISFPGKDHLTNAVVEGTFKYYISESGVFVMFILAEQDGNYSVCFARGTKDKDPMGESFERWMTFSSLDDARPAYSTLEAKASDHLRAVSSETNA